MRWQLQEAKMKFSGLVKRAAREGPQIVTVHGRPAAVVLSADDYTALASRKPSFTKFLLSGRPWREDGLDAIGHRLNLVIRNAADFADLGVPITDPFEPGAST